MNGNNKKAFPLNLPMLIAALVTFALLLSTLAAVPLSWATLAIIDGLGGDPVEDSGGSGGGGGNKKPSNTEPPAVTSGKYLCSSDGSTVDISGDTDIK